MVLLEDYEILIDTYSGRRVGALRSRLRPFLGTEVSLVRDFDQELLGFVFHDHECPSEKLLPVARFVLLEVTLEKILVVFLDAGFPFLSYGERWVEEGVWRLMVEAGVFDFWVGHQRV